MTVETIEPARMLAICLRVRGRLVIVVIGGSGRGVGVSEGVEEGVVEVVVVENEEVVEIGWVMVFGRTLVDIGVFSSSVDEITA
jgi:hypothetical protein